MILIKPDAVERRLAGEILGRIERRGLTLRAGKLIHVDRQLGETHYAEHREKPFFGELVEFITSGPTWALVVEGEGAIATLRKHDRRHQPRRRRAGLDPRRPCRRNARQPRPRIGFAGVSHARDRPLVLGR